MTSMNDAEISEWQSNTCKLYSQGQSAAPEVSRGTSQLTPNEERLEMLVKQIESISATFIFLLNKMSCIERSLEAQTARIDAMMPNIENQSEAIAGIEAIMNDQAIRR